jgi:hypothetical protein
LQARIGQSNQTKGNGIAKTAPRNLQRIILGVQNEETIRLARKRRPSKAKQKALKYKKNGCAICGSMKDLEGHHLYKYAVFKEKEGFDQIVWLCQYHHRIVEQEITRKENIILQQHSHIYKDTLLDFINCPTSGK